jgi:hypothetical protein
MLRRTSASGNTSRITEMTNSFAAFHNALVTHDNGGVF